MTGKKVLIVLGVVLVGAAVVAANLYYRRDTGLNVQAEALRARDLEAIVSASGKVQPKRQVNVSAQTPGRVTRIAVEEGQRVKAGQFLLEIDPKQLEGQLQRGEASVAAAQSSLLGARTSVEQGRANLELARQNLKRQEDLWKEGLTTKENLEKAQNDVTVREADLRARTQDIETNEQRIKQEQAGLSTTRYNLNQIIITAPMDGLVTRRSIEEGETAVVGTMNNAGICPADDRRHVGDRSRSRSGRDRDPDRGAPSGSQGDDRRGPRSNVQGTCDRDRQQPDSDAARRRTRGQRQATTFKVVITLEEPVPDIRPGFTCTAEITTAKRKDVVAVPIQALTVREMLYNDKGEMVRETPNRRRRGTNIETPLSASNEPPPGHTRKETEGVFAIRDGKAIYLPVKVGIAGEQYFEVLDGLKAGDQVITGPFSSVRELSDGQTVKIQQSTRRTNDR